MSIPRSSAERPDFQAAFLSAFLPGLGQGVRGHSRQAAFTISLFIILVGGLWLIWRQLGGAAAIFIFMLAVLPCWVLQSYMAGIPGAPLGLRPSLQRVWGRGLDIRYLGGLFLLAAGMDFYIIAANPEYAITVFCIKPLGLAGLLVKLQSPTFHTLIGYGFLRLRRWSLVVYLVYAAYGLSYSVANLACFGYGRIRTVFIASLIGFTVYILWRRHSFRT